MRQMQSVENPVVAGDVHTAVTHFVLITVAIEQLLLEIEDRSFRLVRRDHDRCCCRTRLVQTNRQFAVRSTPGQFIPSAAAENHIACLRYGNGLTDIEPWLLERSVTRLIITRGRYIIGLMRGYVRRAREVRIRFYRYNATAAALTSRYSLFNRHIVDIHIIRDTGDTDLDCLQRVGA